MTDSKVRLSVNEKDHDGGTSEMFYIDYANIVKVIKKGDTIFIDDGLIALEVETIGNDYIDAIVKNEGHVSNHKGVNLPGVDVDLPPLSEKDKSDLLFGIQQDVDFIFASFIRSAYDVKDIQDFLKQANPNNKIKIISKLENHQGIENLMSIVDITDGVMVARGDLGIEIPAEKVCLAQKKIIACCNYAGKPVVVATQMLESMIKNPRPTRAEVSDVANAVLDGCDCVMLSGETAKGKYPLQAVEMMARICKSAESARNSWSFYNDIKDSMSKPLPPAETVACAAVMACFEQHAKGIIILTNSGDSARFIAKYRPPCPIIAVVGDCDMRTQRQLTLSSGVFVCNMDYTKGNNLQHMLYFFLFFFLQCVQVLIFRFLCVKYLTFDKTKTKAKRHKKIINNF